MIRAVLLFLGLAQATEAALRSCKGNRNGWCYCYSYGTKWCWINQDGSNAYYRPGKYQCSSWNNYPPETFCRGAAAKSVTAKAVSASTASKRTNTGSPWQKYLGSLRGKSSMPSWTAACKAAGKSPEGYSMSASTYRTTYTLTCGGTKISVQCKTSSWGGRFTSCSSGYQGSSTTSGSSSTASGRRRPSKTSGSSSGAKPAGSYNVKAKKYAYGAMSQADVQKMLDLHNAMRCAAGSPPLKWSADIEKQAQQTQNKIRAFSHSSSYRLPISVGENLATGNSVDEAAWMWFTELLISTNYNSGGMGHYTAMVWKGVTEMGCGKGDNVIRCQYKGNPSPNMGGSYSSNVPAFANKMKQCGLSATTMAAKARKYKKWGILSPNGDIWNSLGLKYSEGDGVKLDDDNWTANMSVISGCVFGGVVAMGAVFFAVRLWRRGEYSTLGSAPNTDESELLNVEPTEA